MAGSTVRWGILGSAFIARKNWRSIWNSGNATLTAVASRSVDRAEEFIADCQRYSPFERKPTACGTYQELLERDDVDAVYIPLPTGIRCEWVVKAAEAGKHVVCEKPCGANVGEVEKMLEACRKNRVQFMDGVMFMHSRRLEKIREVLDDGKSVGQLKRIASHFSFLAPEDFRSQNIRVSSHLEPHGCLGDLGWYNVRFTLWAMKWQMPKQVTGRLIAQHGRSDSPAPVPMEFSAELLFPGDVSASFYCSFLTGHQQWAHLSGSHGYLSVQDFVVPFFGGESAFELNSPELEFDGPFFNMVSHPRRMAVTEYSNGFGSSQETNLFREFSRIVSSGELQPKWGAIALQTQQVIDACLASALNGSQPVLLS